MADVGYLHIVIASPATAERSNPGDRRLRVDIRLDCFVATLLAMTCEKADFTAYAHFRVFAYPLLSSSYCKLSIVD